MKRHGFWSSAALATVLVVGGCAHKQVRSDAQPTPTSQSAPAKAAGQPGAPGPAAGVAGPKGAAAASAPVAPPPGTAAVALAAQQPRAGGALSGVTGTGLRRIQFDFDQAALGADARATLTANAEFLKGHRDKKVRIEGHCDERGTAEYNIALGERRAKSALQFLADLGIDKARMSVVSFGEESPADKGHTEEAWAKNRRAEFVEPTP